ncbi:Gfo/Idh/MocA family protein [Proteiniclasticum sp. C24MP]|uniref:Gfo/Idh/MocA family protein n=1 Tax=Proteiniclasticum sp. C24MP TaxID=3374101 RepID=UPI0037550F60
MRKINWGVLGFARIAKNEGIPAILEAESASLYAVASRNEEKLTEAKELFHPEKLYLSYEELLRDEKVDAIYVPFPNALHKEWAIKAMEAGKHVLCEKPLALNEEEVREMVEASRKHKVLLMEAFMYRYTERTRKVQEVLNSGLLGEIRHVDSTFRFFLNREGTIKMKPELGGGALYDVGCYPVNFATMIMQEEPVKISAAAKIQDQVDVQISALLEYKDGKTASLHAGFNAFGKNHSEILGTEGRLEIPDSFLDNEGTLTLHTSEGKEEIHVPACHRYTLEFEDFSSAILENRAPMLTQEESILNARILDYIFQVL